MQDIASRVPLEQAAEVRYTRRESISVCLTEDTDVRTFNGNRMLLLLFNVCVRLKDKRIRALSQTCKEIHSSLLRLSEDQYFYYRRTEYLLKSCLKRRPRVDWRQAYYLLLDLKPFESYILSCELVVSILLEIDGIPATANLGYICNERSAFLLLQSNVDFSKTQEHFLSEVAVGRTNNDRLLKTLLADRRFTCVKAINEALVRACSLGRTSLVHLLLRDNRVDPNFFQGVHSALYGACLNDRRSIVSLLLVDARVEDINSCLRIAYHGGHAEIVKLLLRDKRLVSDTFVLYLRLVYWV